MLPIDGSRCRWKSSADTIDNDMSTMIICSNNELYKLRLPFILLMMFFNPVISVCRFEKMLFFEDESSFLYLIKS